MRRAGRGPHSGPPRRRRETPRVLAVPNRANAYVTLAGEGSRVVAAWAASGEKGTDAYVAVSADAGRSFTPPVRVNDIDGDVRPSGEQPPRVVMRGQSMDVVWVSKRNAASVILTSSSTDGGATWAPARLVSPDGLGGARGWESAAIADDGSVHAVWLDGRNADRPSHPSSVNGAHGDMRQDIVHASWLDAGPIVESPVAANVCFCCKTAVASRGADLVVAWRHLFPGGVRDIAVARSSDGGRTFSPPVRVSPDNWKLDACPDDGPSLVLGDGGLVRVAWPTLVQRTSGPAMGIFEAVSRDGGQTFSPRAQLDSGTGAPAHPRIAMSATGARTAVWDELANGERRVMLRLGEAGPVVLGRGAAASYPSVAATVDGMVVGWTDQSGEQSVVRVARVPGS